MTILHVLMIYKNNFNYYIILNFNINTNSDNIQNIAIETFPQIRKIKKTLPLYAVRSIRNISNPANKYLKINKYSSILK